MRESKRREDERGATMRAASNAEQGQLVKKVKKKNKNKATTKTISKHSSVSKN